MAYFIQDYGDGHIERQANKYRYVVDGKQMGEEYDSIADLSKAHPLTADGGAANDGYASMTVEDLKAEIQRRNEGREEADHLSTTGKKADLVAALEADDSKSE